MLKQVERVARVAGALLMLTTVWTAAPQEAFAQDPIPTQATRAAVEVAVGHMASQPALQHRRLAFDLDRRVGVGALAATDRFSNLPVRSLSSIKECQGERLDRRCRFTADDVDVVVSSSKVLIEGSIATVDLVVNEAILVDGEEFGGVGGAAYRVHLERRGASWVAVRFETLWVS